MVKRKMEDLKFNNTKNIEIPNRNLNFGSYVKPMVDDVKDEDIFLSKNVDKNKSFQDRVIDNSSHRRMRSTPNITSKSPLNRWIGLFFILSFLLFIFYWSSVFFEATKVVIENKKQSFSLEDKKFIASKEIISNNILFEIMIIEDQEFKNITLSESQDVSLKSKGEIVLYNEYSTASQKILANTYIKDDDGRLYTLDSEVSIPGYTIDGDRIIPGSITTTASSFLAGDSYNGNPKNFKINAFEGTSKFDKIYAKAKTEFNGGALGLVYYLTSADKGVVNSYAMTSFKNNLYREVQAQIPDGYILYPGATSFSYYIDDNLFFKDKNAPIPIKGNLSALIFKKSVLSKALIKNLLPKVGNTELKQINILNLENLKFNFILDNQLITKDLDSAPFVFNGDIDMIWNIDIELIKSKLSGAHKDTVQSILKENPGIKNATVKIFPPWLDYLPEEVHKIKVDIN